jgi:hypothetical protein
MLQSPRFLYRIEKQWGDGTPWPVAPHELASRMSYFIWGAPPDEPLFRAAGNSGLEDTASIEKQARRMLEDPRAIEQSLRFVSEWLHLERLDQMKPSEKQFPDWSPLLAFDMKAETLAFFKEIVWQQRRPLTDLLNAQVSFVTPRLAEHYGLALPETEKASPAELVRVDLKDEPSRGGLLTQGSVLTMGGDEASMVTRGLFVFHDLLRGTVNNPPPGLNVEPVPTKAGLTHRDVSEQRIENRNCGSCHVKFEPLAFGLEKFDGLGTWREKDEHNNALRDDGEVLVPGTEEAVPYQNSAELMEFLAKNDRVAESLTRKLAQFAVGRPLTASDVPALNEIHRKAKKEGGTYQSLIVAIVASDLVRNTRTERAD